MISKNIFLKNAFVAILLFICTYFVYRFTLDSFFQQDEWVSLGATLGGGIFAELANFPLYQLAAGYVRPLGTLTNSILHALFPLNPIPFAIFGMLFHWSNGILLYILIKRLTNNVIGLLSSLFFIFAHSHHQAMTWFAATTTTLPSFTFSLLAFLLVTQKDTKKSALFIVLSQVCLVISYLFKESSIVFFIFVPIFWYLFTVQRGLPNFKKVLLFTPLLIYIIYILGIRYLLFTTVDRRGAFITGNSGSIKTIFSNIVLYPMLGVSQEFVPPIYTYKIANYIYPSQEKLLEKYGIQGYKKVLLIRDTISVSLTVLILLIATYFTTSQQRFRMHMFLALSLLFISFIPLAILHRGESYFDSRYFYPASLGGSLLFALLLYQGTHLFLRRNNKVYIFLSSCIVLFASGYLYKNYTLTRATILQNNVEAKERVKILRTIHNFFPSLQPKPIFYVTGDSIGYYGVGEQKVPFQQGFGYSLMVYYFKSKLIPNELLVDSFKLWDMRFQGYWEYGDKGFGYYWSIVDLQQLIDSNGLISPDQVNAVYWHSSEKRLEDITPRIRDQLKVGRKKL